MSERTLYPTIVLIPQWLVDGINKLAVAVESEMTDKMRADGWTPQALAGGVLFAVTAKASIDAMPDE